ncbi:MAG: hypothetical protein KDJ86_14665 [Bauldia sp.]|uniref:hypothetical protein n=1 Tax=Bauldia sp. TaxID=2575872 RepID=UPI001D4BDCA5|nr:hypothetical protein [Bauldia sp.]MCB1497027.1 hypothetical protein [Bauldia sp.]
MDGRIDARRVDAGKQRQDPDERAFVVADHEIGHGIDKYQSIIEDYKIHRVNYSIIRLMYVLPTFILVINYRLFDRDQTDVIHSRHLHR